MPAISKVRYQKILKQKKILSQEILMFQQVMEALRRGLSKEKLFKLR